MKNPILNLAARTAEAVVTSQPKENGIHWPGCFLWSYEPKMPASMMGSNNIDDGSDEPLVG